MRTTLRWLVLPLTLTVGCDRSDEPTSPPPSDADAGAYAVTDEVASCCTPGSLRQLPVSAPVELPTFSEDVAEVNPADAIPAPELPEGEGPWRRPLAGGHRFVRLVRAEPTDL